MNLTPEEEKQAVKAALVLAGEVVALRAEVDMLKTLCGMLLVKQGEDPKGVISALESVPEARIERELLKLGETYPQVAEIMDVNNVLEKARRRAAGEDKTA
jgi:hypothetical protein